MCLLIKNVGLQNFSSDSPRELQYSPNAVLQICLKGTGTIYSELLTSK